MSKPPERQDWGIHIAIISHKRARRVAPMMEALGKAAGWYLGKRIYEDVGKSAVWYVGNGEADEYREAGADHIIESGGLCESRNLALRNSWKKNLVSVQLSDDVNWMAFATARFRQHYIPFWTALGVIRSVMSVSNAKLGGISPTTNELNFQAKRSISTVKYILGDFMVIKPCGLFFDENLKLKEDYDYTLQHLEKYGCVVRCDILLAEFVHRTNKGGVVGFRTDEREQETIRYLREKWPLFIRSHPTRKNEIFLKWYPRRIYFPPIRFPRLSKRATKLAVMRFPRLRREA